MSQHMTHRWQRKTEQPSHADDWLMTYADVITLLLCFFAVSLAVSMPKKDIPPIVDPPKPIEQVMKPITILDGNLPYEEIPDAETTLDDKPVTIPDTSPHAAATSLPTVAADAVALAPSPPIPVAAPAPIDAAPASLPEIVDKLKSQGVANIQQTGDRITTLQMDSAAFFDSGSAVLSAAGKSILKEVTLNLVSDKFKNYQITVEGHTDDQPIKTVQFPSNWELSTARASAVVHFFLDQGIDARRLRAAGYADTFPIAPNRDANGHALPENQARNRRVVINLEKIDKSE